MTYEEIHSIRRTLQTTAIIIATEVKEEPSDQNARLHRLHDLRDAALDLHGNLLEALYDEGRVSSDDMVQGLNLEMRCANAFIDGVIACDVSLALKENN